MLTPVSALLRPLLFLISAFINSPVPISFSFSLSHLFPLSSSPRSSFLTCSVTRTGVQRCAGIALQCRDWGENKPVAPQHFSQITHFISCHTSSLPMQPLTSPPSLLPFLLLSISCQRPIQLFIQKCLCSHA